MKSPRNAAVVFVVTVLTLSVSAFASDKTNTIQPVLQMASAAQPAETDHAKATLHEAGDTDATHDASGSDHGNGHPNLGEILPLWSCIPFAFMLLSIALCPLIMPEFWHHHFGKISGFWAAGLAVPFLFAFKGSAVYEILHIVLAPFPASITCGVTCIIRLATRMGLTTPTIAATAPASRVAPSMIDASSST